MRTITDIKDDVDEFIRQKTLPGTITKTNHSAIEDDVLNEIRDRGVIQAASTDELDEHSHDNTLLILVHNVGIFRAVETPDAPDDDTTFASFNEGWLWEKIMDVSPSTGVDRFTRTSDSTYTLAEGYMMDKILIKPSTTQTQKIGLTDEGDEIMLEEELPAGVTKVVNRDVVADGGDVTIYLGGITASTAFTVYKRKI